MQAITNDLSEKTMSIERNRAEMTCAFLGAIKKAIEPKPIQLQLVAGSDHGSQHEQQSGRNYCRSVIHKLPKIYGCSPSSYKRFMRTNQISATAC